MVGRGLAKEACARPSTVPIGDATLVVHTSTGWGLLGNRGRGSCKLPEDNEDNEDNEEEEEARPPTPPPQPKKKRVVKRKTKKAAAAEE